MRKAIIVICIGILLSVIGVSLGAYLNRNTKYSVVLSSSTGGSVSIVVDGKTQHLNENSSKKLSISKGDVLELTAEPSTDNFYQFDKWVVDTQTEDSTNTYIKYTVKSNMKIQAQFVRTEYTVEIVDSSNTKLNECVVSYGDNLIEKFDAALTAAGTGYHYEYTLDAEKVTESTKINANCTVVATKVLSEYTITYVGVEGATNNNPTKYTYNDSFTLTNPVKVGFKFTGWTAADGYTTTISSNTGNITYTANWQVINYTISYSGLEGATNLPTKTSYNVLEGAISVDTPAKSACRFVGWASNVFTGLNQAVVLNSKLIADGMNAGVLTDSNTTITLTANFAQTFNVQFVATGANEKLTTLVSVANERIILPVITRNDAEFIGWSLNADLSGETYKEYTPTEANNLTFYAVWSDSTIGGGQTGQPTEALKYVALLINNEEANGNILDSEQIESLPTTIYLNYVEAEQEYYVYEDLNGSAYTALMINGKHATLADYITLLVDAFKSCDATEVESAGLGLTKTAITDELKDVLHSSFVNLIKDVQPKEDIIATDIVAVDILVYQETAI